MTEQASEHIQPASELDTSAEIDSAIAAVASGFAKEGEDYKVDLEIFEGPLDLLLYLIRKDEIDIYDIPISKITRQYLDYMELMQLLDLNIAGEFVMMAATLMYIKSRTLLPPEEQIDEDEEDIDDPRMDLVRQLLEYKKFKEVAAYLHNMEEEQSLTFSRLEDEVPLAPATDKPLVDVGLFDLLTAFSNVLKRNVPEEPRELEEEEISVGERIAVILATLKDDKRAQFSSFFDDLSSRMMFVATFLAMLELIKQQKIGARQSEHYGEIDIILREVD